MCDTNRRQLLLGAAALSAFHPPASAQEADSIASGVYFHEGDIEKEGHCNNGWIAFRDYVLVVDANFPSGAKLVLPKIRALTDRPVRFAFDTHHHGDHAYGNQVWIENGATAVAHTGVLEEMKRYETGYFGGKPGRWEDTAKTRSDVAASRLSPPSVLFPKELYFDDGKQRVELIHPGVAHTHGDAVAWLPSERILFTGDACVNGPYNYTGDGNVEQWIRTLDVMKKLGARVVCPGHGKRGDASLIEDQQIFFRKLVDGVGAAVRAKKAPREVYGAIGGIRENLLGDKRIARYVGNGFAAQVEKVYSELTGQNFPADVKAGKVARVHHRHDHLRTLA